MIGYMRDKGALLAFNIWDVNSAKSVIDAAIVKQRNIILQTSSNIYEKLDKKTFRQFLSAYVTDKEIEVWLHLDHCRNIEQIKDAIDMGWDSVMIDASELPLEENIDITNRISEYAHKRGVLVEAEIGRIKGVEDEIVNTSEEIAKYEDIKKFLEETNVDMIAVAFGNAHGVYKGTPNLHYEIVEYVKRISDIPFVVHGGSGLDEKVLQELIQIGNVKKINISTEVKLAYREGMLKAYQEGLLDEKGFQPIKVEQMIQKFISDMVCAKLQILEN